MDKERIKLPNSTIEKEPGGVLRITFNKNKASTLVDEKRLDRWAVQQIKSEFTLKDEK